MKFPKVEYKLIILEANLNNLFNLDSWEDAEELFKINMAEVRRKVFDEGKFKATSYFCFNMNMLLGEFITREYFEKLLDYVGLTLEDIERYIVFEKKINSYYNFQWEWYEMLKIKNGK